MKTSDLQNLTIAIVGGGYGGASAAAALSALGANVTVYEQASGMHEVGAGIGLRPSSMNRFREWGIFDNIAAVSSPSDYFEILTATGDPIMKDDWPEDGEEKHTYLIHRGDFIEAWWVRFRRAWSSSATSWRRSRTTEATPLSPSPTVRSSPPTSWWARTASSPWCASSCSATINRCSQVSMLTAP
nr:FAD-dependent monooxygenase [Kocuria atrinae]